MQSVKRNESFVTAKGNDIWLCSLALAWQQLQHQNKLTIEYPGDQRKEEYYRYLISLLQAHCCNSKDIDGSVYFRAGAGGEAAELINKQLQELYGGLSVAKLGPVRNDQVILYGSMHQKFRLAHPFFKIPGKIMHFCKAKIPCFEPMNNQQRKQVFVVKYRNEEDFIVRIDGLEKSSQMFLIASNAKKTLQQVLNEATNSNDEVQSMTINDVFKIPILRIEVSHVSSQLSGIKVKLDDDPKKYEIEQAVQSVCFQLEEQPQTYNMEDLTLTVPEFDLPKLQARRLVLHKPFWLVLKHKGRNPYFAMFVKAPKQI